MAHLLVLAMLAMMLLLVCSSNIAMLKGAKLQLINNGALAAKSAPIEFSKLLGNSPTVVFAVRRPG